MSEAGTKSADRADLARLAVAAMRCATGNRRTVYVSTPVTTGRRFVEWRRGEGRVVPADSDEYRAQWRAHVYDRNVAHVRPLVEALRSRLEGTTVIDPSALADQDGWDQVDYHQFWAAVIRHGADAIVMVEGWQYSVGCALEYVEALTCGVPVLDETLRPVPEDTARRCIAEAVADLSDDGLLDVDGLLRAAALLDGAAERAAPAVSA